MLLAWTARFPYWLPPLSYFSGMPDAVSQSTVSQKTPHAWTAVKKEYLCDLTFLVGGRLLRWQEIGCAAAFCSGAVVFMPGQCPFWSEKKSSSVVCLPLSALPNETLKFPGHSWVLALPPSVTPFGSASWYPYLHMLWPVQCILTARLVWIMSIRIWPPLFTGSHMRRSCPQFFRQRCSWSISGGFGVGVGGLPCFVELWER